MTDFNLRQRLGIHMMTPTHEHCEKVIRNLRFKQTAVSAQWKYFQPDEGGDYRWGWFDGILRDIAEFTSEPPMTNLFQAPAWVDTTLHPRGDPAFPWVPNLPKEKVQQWCDFVEAFCNRYPDIIYHGLDTETNVDGLWKATPQEYAENVIIPAAEIIHAHGKKVVAPGITIQKYESQAHYDKSRAHMRTIVAMCGDHIDVHSIHSYAKSAERTFLQQTSFIKDLGLKAPIWVTETGFPETHYWVEEDILGSIEDLAKSGTQRQLERFQDYIPTVETVPGIARTFIYRGWDIRDEAEKHATNGLLNWRLNQKPAAVYIKEQLMEDKPPPGQKNF